MAGVVLNPVFNNIKGRLGNLVFYNRMGKQCVRIYVIPHNPDTESQRKNRAAFSDAVEAWRALPADVKLLYNKKARIKKRKGYNLFISEYMNGKVETKYYPRKLHNEEEQGSAGVFMEAFSCLDSVPLRSMRYSTPLVPVCTSCNTSQQFIDYYERDSGYKSRHSRFNV